MAQLAIKGHPSKGSKVIEILKLLGGLNTLNYAGLDKDSFYYIGKSGIICRCGIPHNRMVFTFEGFLKRFPYKVGDKVTLDKWPCTITGMAWEIDDIIYYVQGIDFSKGVYSKDKDLRPYKEETMETITIDDFKANTKEWLIDKLHDMVISKAIKTIGDIYEKLHKPQYPKTYGECHELMVQWKEYDCNPNSELILCDATIHDFCKLIVARNIYWKIAGEQMGLGEPWKPNWLNTEQDKFVLYTHNNVICSNRFVLGHNVLAFPTAEMRDIFFENFKDLIEQCKKLL